MFPFHNVPDDVLAARIVRWRAALVRQPEAGEWIAEATHELERRASAATRAAHASATRDAWRQYERACRAANAARDDAIGAAREAYRRATGREPN
jgi:hypothetical protein